MSMQDQAQHHIAQIDKEVCADYVAYDEWMSLEASSD